MHSVVGDFRSEQQAQERVTRAKEIVKGALGTARSKLKAVDRHETYSTSSVYSIIFTASIHHRSIMGRMAEHQRKLLEVSSPFIQQSV